MSFKKIRIPSAFPYHIFFHPAMLALYAWLLLVFLLPDYFQKYTAEIINTEYRSNFEKFYYYDLNGDGISERISTGYNTNRKEMRVQHFNLDDKVYDQWMPRGEWLIEYKPIFGDYNHNGYAEIYCLSVDNDSVFLSIKELMADNGLEVKNRFICKAGIFGNHQQDEYDPGGELIDIDGDGISEYVFGVWGGFSKYPRNLFAYYLIKDSLVMSPESASGIREYYQIMDLNGDGVMEMTGNVGSPENIHYRMPYTDSSAWLMVFNLKTMDFLFEPIRFDLGIGSSLCPVFFKVKNKKYIAVSAYSNAADKNIKYVQLFLFNAAGKFLKEKNIAQKGFKRIVFQPPLNTNDETIYLMDDRGRVYTADTSLNVKMLYNPNLGNVIISPLTGMDVDGDGQRELLAVGGDRKSNVLLVVYRQDFKNATVIELPENKAPNDPHVSLIYKDKNTKHPLLSVQAGNYVYKIKYGENPLYIYKYPAYIVVYLLLFLAFWLLQQIQTHYAQQKFEEEKMLIRQRMALSKKQLEPHFMLNVLNNIGQMFLQEDKEEAQYYFGKFASLIHRGLKYADKAETNLFEELEFVRDYLILQQRRMEDFHFTIEADENVDLEKIKIPYSLVYTFVENAVKHGLKPKAGRKELTIFIHSKGDGVVITISDNGIGRRESGIRKTRGTGKGLKIITDIVEGYNKLNKRNITFKTNDLEEGTEVRIWV